MKQFLEVRKMNLSYLEDLFYFSPSRAIPKSKLFFFQSVSRKTH